jgi:starvation-inducible outer membrane lipoprotein
MKKIILFIASISLSACVAMPEKTPNDLKKSPCACGEIYNSGVKNV